MCACAFVRECSVTKILLFFFTLKKKKKKKEKENENVIK